MNFGRLIEPLGRHAGVVFEKEPLDSYGSDVLNGALSGRIRDDGRSKIE